MISIGNVRDAAYYLAEVAPDDAAGYYANNAVVGRWHGTLASELDLIGHVEPDEFRALLEGRSPAGPRLTEHPTRVRALDMTLSVPKSVSVLWAIADRAVQHQIESSLDQAEAAVLEFVEQEATWVRRGHGGISLGRGSGLVAASFEHHTSRAGDPNLHRHVVIANASRGGDGRITALDTRQIYRVRYTTEAIFQTVLRAELTSRIGYRFRAVDRHGVAEVRGVPRATIRRFSKRRQEIETEMALRGSRTGHGARVAALATREAKQPDPSIAFKLEQWRREAAEVGFDPTRVTRDPRDRNLDIANATLATVLTDHDATYSRWDTIRAVCRSAPDGATLDEVLRRADEYLGSEQAVRIGDDLYTTPEILSLERRAVAVARAGRGAGIGRPDDVAVREALSARPRLAREQRRLVVDVATSGDAIAVIVGQAGAGKTTALDALRDAYERSRHRVIGATLSARAAAELRSGAGIDSYTIHRLLSAMDARRVRLDERSVLVVDEAAMVGTRQLVSLVDHCHSTGSKLVLVGDPRQLPEINAGGAFAALARRTPVIQLTENRRQHDPDQRRALTALRHGDADLALQRLERSGNLTTGPDTDTVRGALVADWHAAVESGEQAVMLASSRADVADLNHRAVAKLHAAGEAGAVVYRGEQIELAEGERFVAHRNRHDLGILNGDQGTVLGPAEKGAIRVRLDRGPRLELPGGYVDAGHITHGYALTVHKAQGMTCDHAFFLGDEGLYNEIAYTGLSRGRHVNHLYAIATRDERGRLLDDPLTDLRRGMGTSRAKTAAIDHGADLGLP